MDDGDTRLSKIRCYSGPHHRVNAPPKCVVFIAYASVRNINCGMLILKGNNANMGKI